MANKEEDEKNEFQGKENDSDDTFGLPEIEYKPIERDEELTSSTEESNTEESSSEETSQQSYYSYQSQEKESEPKAEYHYVPAEEPTIWPKVLGILVVVAVALGAALYFVWYKPMQEEKEKLAEKQKQEQLAKQREQDRLAAEARAREESERRKADSLANVPKVGAFEVLSGATGRYYVVIVSAVDGDLITDHAKKLAKEGVSSKIIPPFGKYKFYRLTIAEGDTYASAQSIADAKKAEFGAAWVLKY
jgi:hypothetical protein